MILVRRIAAALSVAYAGACALVLAVFAGPIAGGFTGDLSVVSVATQLLWVAGIFQVFDAIKVVARGGCVVPVRCASRRWSGC